jgi:hypothetical protein
VNETFLDKLSYPVSLQKAGKSADDSEPETLRAGERKIWNLGFLLSHEHRFDLAVTNPKPLNFEEMLIRENGRLRVEIKVVSRDAGPKTIQLEVCWDGTWIDNDPEAMNSHLVIRPL